MNILGKYGFCVVVFGFWFMCCTVCFLVCFLLFLMLRRHFLAVFGVFWYVCGMYEGLYGCLGSSKSYDMSRKGHIVYVSYRNTNGW